MRFRAGGRRGMVAGDSGGHGEPTVKLGDGGGRREGVGQQIMWSSCCQPPPRSRAAWRGTMNQRIVVKRRFKAELSRFLLIKRHRTSLPPGGTMAPRFPFYWRPGSILHPRDAHAKGSAPAGRTPLSSSCPKPVVLATDTAAGRGAGRQKLARRRLELVVFIHPPVAGTKSLSSSSNQSAKTSSWSPTTNTLCDQEFRTLGLGTISTSSRLQIGMFL